MIWLYWLIAAGVFFLGEILSPSFILFWFGIGALAAAGLALTPIGLYYQVAAFIVISTILLLFTRPLMKRLIKHNNVESNVYAMAGKKGIVIQEINNILGTGQVKVSGEVWQARSSDDNQIPAQTEVEIVKVEGVKVIVSQVVNQNINEGVLK